MSVSLVTGIREAPLVSIGQDTVLREVHPLDHEADTPRTAKGAATATEERPTATSPAEAFADILRQRGGLSDEALDRARFVQRESKERLDAVLTRLGLVTEQALAEAMAEASALPIVDQAGYPAAAVPGPPIAAAFLHSARCIPIADSGAEIIVAVANPLDDFVERALSFVFARPVRRVVGRASDIDAAIERLYRPQAEDTEVDVTVDGEDLERLKDLVSDVPVIKAVNRLIARASDERASDIHLEPTDDALRVRFRIDGALRDMPPLPAAMRAPLISRIKIMAALNIAEKRLPQDGRLRIAVRGHEIDLRVATAPSIHGESAVLRILDRSKLALDFTSLGFDDALIASFRRSVHAPHGIVLVTGPTGSGKTTTLYAALAELNKRERKLLTIEDPIEYRLPGVVQAQVNPTIGFSYGAALRSFLRQDPDVVMVGEIRDGETAEIAVQAALTGHMILSTLHTNTAAGAVTRLLDMGIEPFLLGSVLTGVLAQRLVRRLCAECHEPYRPDSELAPMFATANLAMPERMFRPRGCAECAHTGYAGRIAIFDFLPVTTEIARMILARADTLQIAEAAQRKSAHSLLRDGLAKAMRGLTSVEEVLRVVEGD
jgi:general secretion pathway protein E